MWSAKLRVYVVQKDYIFTGLLSHSAWSCLLYTSDAADEL